jgi:hypothetical protein
MEAWRKARLRWLKPVFIWYTKRASGRVFFCLFLRGDQMSPEEFYHSFQERLFDQYPYTFQLRDNLNLQHVVSPYVVQLDRSILERAQKRVAALYQISRDERFQKTINCSDQEVLANPPNNLSILMAYDFHSDSQRDALIEVNTNAAMYLITDLLHQIHGDTFPFERPALAQLKEAFLTEYRLFREDSLAKPQYVAIIDENIQAQNRFVEFLMFKSLFEEWGWTAGIWEKDDLKVRPEDHQLLTKNDEVVDFVYNRFCDFYLSEEDSRHLRRAYLEGWACFSPNPHEYLLLADKARLMELGRQDFQEQLPHLKTQWEQLRPALLTTRDAQSFESPEELWKLRKSLFFKPKNEYGGKSVYRGSRITKSVFNRAVEENFLVQEYAPAPTPTFRQKDVDTKDWRFDIRYYVYQGEIHNVVARIYKGQVTNFSTEMGGFAAVEFI